MRAITWAAFASILLACGGAEPPPAPKPAPAPAEKAPKKEAPKEAPVDLSTMSPEEQQAKLMEIGENVYKKGGKKGLACLTCHQENGKGVPGAFPPLVGQKDHMGDCVTHAGLVINGLQGEIEVDGVVYNGVMTPQGDLLTDLEIAAVVTYERLSWGNDYGPCLPGTVATARKGE
ncbi:MAG: mono/diheme cytochrome c family protein [Myxococcota bacterium]|jgi:mono/diheme cytochrome c family protein